VDQLRREVKAGSLATPQVFLTFPMNDDRGTSFVVPLDYYIVGINRAKAWKFFMEMWHFKTDHRIKDEDRFKEFERQYHRLWKFRSAEEWGLMLIFWADNYRQMPDPDGKDDKIDPDEHIVTRLGQWLKIELSIWKPFSDRSWLHKLVGDRLAIKLSPQWKQLMAYEGTARLNTLEAAIKIGAPALVRMALVIVSALPLTRFGWAVAVSLQSIVGLLDFLFTSWEAERDDTITEEELNNVSWAVLGIFGFGAIQLTVLGARLALLQFELLKFIGEAALQLRDELPSRLAADKAGYDEFVSSVYRDDEAPDSVFVLLDA
jgi:hypothetical protein